MASHVIEPIAGFPDPLGEVKIQIKSGEVLSGVITDFSMTPDVEEVTSMSSGGEPTSYRFLRMNREARIVFAEVGLKPEMEIIEDKVRKFKGKSSLASDSQVLIEDDLKNDAKLITVLLDNLSLTQRVNIEDFSGVGPEFIIDALSFYFVGELKRIIKKLLEEADFS